MIFRKGDIVHWYNDDRYIAIVLGTRKGLNGKDRFMIRWIAVPKEAGFNSDKPQDHTPLNFVLMVKNNAIQ